MSKVVPVDDNSLVSTTSNKVAPMTNTKASLATYDEIVTKIINNAIASLTMLDNITACDARKVKVSSLPFPKDGIRLSSLQDFYDVCGGKDKLKGLTTTDINEMYQKPFTASSGLSYCEYLRQQNSPNVGPAVVFISHGIIIALILIKINSNTNTTISMEIPILRCYECYRVSFS